jgi:hypothetical protein
MGLFSTVLHIYMKSQDNIVTELSKELRDDRKLPVISRIEFINENYQMPLDKDIYSQERVFYLITQPHGDWTTIIELNVNLTEPFYLYELTNSLSKRLNTYALSFHLHDDDVLIYNLDKNGESLDGYNSNYQYFLAERADPDEILTQRHTPQYFSPIMPATKSVDNLNEILNEGYWTAFDKGELDEEGVPTDDRYFIEEENRFVRVGKYLEIFLKDDYPFADWRSNFKKLDPDNCYLLKAVK